MSRRLSCTMLAVAAVLAMLLPRLLGVEARLVWNASASVPIGLYDVSPPRELHVGDIAVVTPPEPLADLLAARRSLPKGVLLIKPIAALAGQIVCREGLRIAIDGVAVGAALDRDHQGRPLPVWQGCRQLGPRDVFVMNPAAPDSFDGRYFGVLPMSAVIGRASALWLPKELTMQPNPFPAAIPLFDRKPHHSSVPTEIMSAAARRGSPGRPPGRRASASPWTGASTVARSRSFGMAVRSMVLAASVLAMIGGAAFAQSLPVVAPRAGATASDPFAGFIAEAAQRFGIPAAWIRAVMQAESAGMARAVSPKGAMGLMQIMPDTWAALRARYHFGADPFDAHDNIMAGAAYLRELHDRYGAPGFLAAYQAGPARYEDYLATGRPLPAETRAYVAALAPTMDGIPDGSQAAAANAADWTVAPLFAVQRAASPSTIVQSPAASPDRPSPSPTTVALSVLAPQSDGLFVALAPQRGPP